MLGRYVAKEFSEDSVKSLGRSEGNDFVCDITKDMPDFKGNSFETVIHCAGTESDTNADSLNFDGTRRLLESLSKNPPRYFVFVSSYQVYSTDAGENIDEEANTWAVTTAGKSKARAEELLRNWAEEKDVTLTIIRPARMFGNGVSGDTLKLFNDALSGRYIHIRGNDARISLVTAYDVARAIQKVYKKGGLYNAADGCNPRFIEMVEAMTANAGSMKRMTHLPANWAEWIWRFGRWMPFIDRNLHPEVVEKRMKTLTLDGSRLMKAAGFPFFNTIEVMSLTSKDYPYSFNNPVKSENTNIYEA